jgi:hypothetical protein
MGGRGDADGGGTHGRHNPAPSASPLRWLPLIACIGVVSVLVVVCYIAVFVDVDINPCTMTYMYPNYVRIQDKNFSRLSHKYELYLYKEGINVRNEVGNLSSSYPFSLPFFLSFRVIYLTFVLFQYRFCRLRGFLCYLSQEMQAHTSKCVPLGQK